MSLEKLTKFYTREKKIVADAVQHPIEAIDAALIADTKPIGTLRVSNETKKPIRVTNGTTYLRESDSVSNVTVGLRKDAGKSRGRAQRATARAVTTGVIAFVDGAVTTALIANESSKEAIAKGVVIFAAAAASSVYDALSARKHGKDEMQLRNAARKIEPRSTSTGPRGSNSFVAAENVGVWSGGKYLHR